MTPPAVNTTRLLTTDIENPCRCEPEVLKSALGGPQPVDHNETIVTTGQHQSKIVVIILLAVILACQPAFTADEQQTAHEKILEKIEAARLAAAKNGGADEAYQLGWFYSADDTRRYTDAAVWFQKAAEGGKTAAQLELSDYYRAGKGVPEDWTESLKWLRRAADAGDARGEFALADQYSVGFGEPRSTNDTPVQLLMRAAAKDNPDATIALARRYQYGAGVETDFWRAATLYFKLDLHEHQAMASGISLWLAAARDSSLPPEDAFGRFAVHYLRAIRNSPASQNQIGQYLRDGWNTPANPTLAVKYFRTAAQQKDRSAQKNLGLAYERGVGVEKDLQQAISWYGSAAENGLPEAAVAKARLEKEMSTQSPPK